MNWREKPELFLSGEGLQPVIPDVAVETVYPDRQAAVAQRVLQEWMELLGWKERREFQELMGFHPVSAFSINPWIHVADN